MKKEEYLTTEGKNIFKALKAGGYVKGYGELVRVMDKDHNPLFNASKRDFQWLLDNGFAEKTGIIFTYTNKELK